MKFCTNKKCKQANPQPLTNFYTHARDGYQSHCKICQNERNKERVAYRKEYYSDPEVKAKQLESSRKPERKKKKSEYDKTPEARAKKAERRATEEYQKVEKEYREKPEIKEAAKKNKEKRKEEDPITYSAKTTANTVKRNNAKLKRTLSWLTEEHFREIEDWYILANELQWLSIERLQVDHIIPLQGKNVSGLHVPWNLQILGQTDNYSKSNSFDGTYDNNSWKNKWVKINVRSSR